MNTAECPECGAAVTFNSAPVLSEIVECKECGSELEVKVVEPVTLALAPQEEEDWGE
ncbi:MAG: lysine biosynthesis protein LysW [Ignavibacteria bacterium]